MEIGGFDGFLWQCLCGHSSLAEDSPVAKDMRVREWDKCGLGFGTSPGGCKQPCFIVLPVLWDRRHYCVSANYPFGALGCISPTPLHSCSLNHSLSLPFSCPA